MLSDIISILFFSPSPPPNIFVWPHIADEGFQNPIQRKFLTLNLFSRNMIEKVLPDQTCNSVGLILFKLRCQP